MVRAPARLWLAAAALLARGLWPAPAGAVEAELRVFSPVVEEDELDIENNSSLTFDKSRPLDKQQTYFNELGYGVTDFWRTELEGVWDTGSERHPRLRTVDFENDFWILHQDEHWLDGALLVEYDHAVDGSSPESFELGPLLQKTVGQSTTNLNVFFGRDIGRNAMHGTEMIYIGQSTWTLTPLLAPGVKFFGVPGSLGNLPAVSQQDHRLGPILTGDVDFGEAGTLSYNLGYLFGLTPGAPSGTLVGRLEYNLHF